jgi:hypothetical protein
MRSANAHDALDVHFLKRLVLLVPPRERQLLAQPIALTFVRSLID